MNWNKKTLKRLTSATLLGASLLIGASTSATAQDRYWRYDQDTRKRHQKAEQRELKRHQRLEREQFGNDDELRRHQKEERRELKRHQKMEKRSDWRYPW